MSVDIKDVESKLINSFRDNLIFNENNINKEGTVEYKFLSYVLKLQKYLKVDLSNFYEKLKTLKLEPLSVYSNDGLVSYDALENVGRISPKVLKNDDENKYNIDNIFTQLALMVSTSRDNYYGFGNVRELDALNQACTYMIASNLAGSSEKNYSEEELMFLNMLDNTLGGTKSRIDFVTAYLSNNGVILKEEINKSGITDELLNEMNYLNEAKKNGLNIPDRYASITNKINRNFALLVSNRVISDPNIISKYKADLLNDNVLDYSNFGVTKVSDGMLKAMDYINNKSNIVNINDYTKNSVMQKAA
ncbi:MAG: hypothetical protein IJ094_02445 [Bacilli bacterium]|nr:hypothetical protein [Bacilli bacterium]